MTPNDNAQKVGLAEFFQSLFDEHRAIDGLSLTPKGRQALEARATVEAMAEALKLARSELDGLPHSLGYEFTHIPKIDAALARYEGTPNAD